MRRTFDVTRHLRLPLTLALVACASTRHASGNVVGSLTAQHGVIVSAHHLASLAGVEVMRAGGNAVDGAVATGFALAVVLPRAGNLGGGGFMIVRDADGSTHALDFREVAPAAARRNMYLDEQGQVVPGRSTEGYLASGVPGTVAGLAHAWRHHGSGRVAWADLIEPARRLAAEGFEVSTDLAEHLVVHRALLAANAESRRIFLRDDRPFAAGEIFRQPELAATLARLQTDGAEDFYTGATAALIVADQVRGGGLITSEDLAAYRVVPRAALRGRYRDFEFITMPPPSSGGVALTQILGMLEPHDLRSLGRDSPAGIHLVVETMRRAFRDRARWLGDPDFAPVPLARLTAPEYLRRVMADFDPDHASPDLPDSPTVTLAPESVETTHFAAADASGTIAACTYTLNGNYGSGVTVAGAGFLLNNEMDDFTARPGAPNMFGLLQSDANAIAPGKRPLSSMTPTLLLRDGRPVLVTGSPGGPTIITTVLHVLLNVVDHDLTPAAAVAAPRFHHQWQPDEIRHEPGLAQATTLDALEQRGHRLALRQRYGAAAEQAGRPWGDAQTIAWDHTHGRLIGISDPRSPDAAPAGW